MTTGQSWEDANNRYLAASLEWLRARLDALASAPQVVQAPATAVIAEPTHLRGVDRRWWCDRSGRVGPAHAIDVASGAASELPAGPGTGTTSGSPLGFPHPPDIGPAGGSSGSGGGSGTPAVDRAAAEREAAAAAEDTASPALLQLAARLELSDFERDVLLLCVAPAIESGIASRIAAVHGDPGATAPTFALALRLFDDPHWDVLSPERGLRFWRLVEPVAVGAQPLTTAPLRADDRIVDLARGLNYMDERLAALVEHRPDPVAGLDLPASSQAAVDALVRAALTDTPDGRLPVVQLLGGDEPSCELVAVRAAARLNRDLYHAPVAALARAGTDLDEVARRWQRESLLLPIALMLDAIDADLTDAVVVAAVRRFLSRAGGIVLLATREVWPVADRATAVVDVARPTPAEQRDMWAVTTGLPLEGAPTALAGQFRLGVSTIHRIATALRPALDAMPAEEAAAGQARLWAACRASARPRLEALAQRTVPRARWDDLVLPEEQMSLLRNLVTHVRHRATVFSTWGFEERMARGNGVTALFSGPSGTGKTFATEALANELGLDLYRIDLSAVVNKYIGETEKNLRRVFDAAEDGGALLLFDEADALFGRRSQVRDSHDRYANIEVSYLLQRMEAYDGVAVLATNLRAALDPAFLRRLRFVVDFPLPAQAERRRLWAGAFPADVPLGDLDLDALVDLPVTGAAVQAIALGAAFLAADTGEPVDTTTVLRAAQVEFRKLGLPVTAPSREWVRR